MFCACSYLLDTLIFILKFLNAGFTLKNFEIIIDKNNNDTTSCYKKKIINKNHLNEEMKYSYKFI
jgi:DNA-binding transcriptional MerR regulator